MRKMGWVDQMKLIIYLLILKPIIVMNYKNRYKSAINGNHDYPDQWYWADKIAVKWGFYTGWIIENE